MGKNIYIGDIHGLDVWEQIVDEHKDADNIVFIGDYFDSFDIGGLEQLRNIGKIVEFKKDQELDPTKKVYLLIGNHDHHYWPGVIDRGGTSGFQVNMMYQFEMFFRENEKHFQLAVMLENHLCTHAGVSSKYIDDFGYWKDDKHTDESHIADWLNDLFKYQPNKFLFTAGYDKNNTGFAPNGYGDDEWQCPLWIRPRSLQRVNKGTDLKKNYIQIVGHTQQNKLDINGKATGGKYYYIDTLPNGEYLIYEDGEFKIGYYDAVTYI
jgi:predicted phosphodiesterase